MTDIIAGPSATIPSGSRVLVSVSRGADPSAAPYVAVPDVTGAPQARAVQRLEHDGFAVRAVNDYSDAVRRGHVIGQLPQPGSSALSGSEALLLVSSGPAAHPQQAVILPEVIGLQEQEGTVVLESAGLSPQIVREYSARFPDGVVTAQLPDRAWLTSMHKRRTPWWIWAVVAGAIVLLALLAFLLFGRQSRVSVPDVVGMPQAEAVAAIQEAGLTAEVAEQPSPDAAIPVGHIATQTPVPGEIVPKGTVVELGVVGEPAANEVPDVVGLTAGVAQQRLRDAGFSVRIIERESDDDRPGYVIEQSPEAGTELSPGGRVTITVARAAGAEVVTVPNVEGLVQADAESTLRGAGLDVQIAENPSMQVATGVVMMQYPVEGDQVAPGITVGIIVSSGAPEDAATVGLPNVVGEELPDAQADIAKAGLRSQPVAVDGSDAERNEVIAQLPPAGAAVSPGSMILLFYSSGR